MHHTTGLSRAEIEDLTAGVATAHPHLASSPGRAHTLGLFTRVRLTLMALRMNVTQAQLGELFDISQPTVSRIVTALTPVIAALLDEVVPRPEDLTEQMPLVIDGTVVPCWDWDHRCDLYSVKHHTPGHNLQVATTLDGDLAWISDPTPGSTHDLTALRATGLLEGRSADQVLADKGYQGAGLLTPIRKPPGRPLLAWQKKFNRDHAGMRYVVERAIAHLKNWKTLATPYRRPLRTVPDTISAIVALEFWRRAYE